MAFPPSSLDFGDGLHPALNVLVENGNRASHFRQTDRDLPADSRCSSRHHGNLAFQRQQLPCSIADIGHIHPDPPRHETYVAYPNASRARSIALRVSLTSSVLWAAVTIECSVAAGLVYTPYSNNFRENR